MLLDLFLWAVLTGFTLFSAGHALLNKRDPRAALIWIVLCFSLPGVGAASYWILGVNRIRTRARGWQEEGKGLPELTPAYCDWSPEKSSILPFRSENFAGQLNLVDHVTRRPLVPGNFLQPLHDGEEAFPAMLNAIAGSKETICLSTYIFESNETGRRFTDALIRAAERGVEVRVLIDALGERYSFPSIRRLFRGSKVKVGRFLPPSLLGRGIFLNLRNHRKILVADGNLGFVGGMNIGDRHLVDLEDNPRRVSDIHFAVFGPVIGHLEDAFNEDWFFATGEEAPTRTYKELPPFGEAFARGISAGPNEEHEKLQWIIVGALNCARHSIRIMTPYFIPDRSLVSAINAASLRGVEVEIILPEKNNLRYVGWAMRSYLWEVMQHGTMVYFQPPPFVHSKLMVVDDQYSIIGSANLDPRSLRLNFEFNLEVYDRNFAGYLTNHFDDQKLLSRPVTLEELDRRPLPGRLRDAAVKLFSPYL